MRTIEYDDDLWTSKLSIRVQVDDERFEPILVLLKKKMENYPEDVQNMLDWRSSDVIMNPKDEKKARTVLSNRLNILDISDELRKKLLEFSLYQFKAGVKDAHIDCTGFLKGLLIGLIGGFLHSVGVHSFVINFGGDILIYDPNMFRYLLQIDWWSGINTIPLKFKRDYMCIFSSDNSSERRGKHIKCFTPFIKASASTVIRTFDNSKDIFENCIELDYLATSLVSRWHTKVKNVFAFIKFRRKVLFKKYLEEGDIIL